MKEINSAHNPVNEINPAEEPVNEAIRAEELAKHVTQAQEKQNRRSKEMLSLIKLYIMADKLNMEQCVNDIVDQYQSYLQFQGLDPDSFEHLIKLGPPECELRNLLVAEMAYEARLEGFENYKHKKDVLFNSFVQVDLDNALHFAQCLCDVRKEPAQQTRTCKWHRHTQTAKCVWP